MKQQSERIEHDDVPVGIVISGGARGDVTPRFSAFVWGPAPEAVGSEAAIEAKAA
jgi:hypothetical protein